MSAPDRDRRRRLPGLLGLAVLGVSLALGAALMVPPPPNHVLSVIGGIGLLVCCGGWLSAYGLHRGIAAPVIVASSSILVMALAGARSAADQWSVLPLTVVPDDRTCAIHVTGDLSSSLYRRLQRALDEHPATRAIVLESAGGSALGIAHVARLLRERGVNTAVMHDQCDSACAFLWVSAQRRIIAAPKPTIAPGFHAPHLAAPWAGTLRAPLQERQQRAFLESAGLPAQFIGWAYAPLDAVWRPDQRALNGMGVTTEWIRTSAPASLSFCPSGSASL